MKAKSLFVPNAKKSLHLVKRYNTFLSTIRIARHDCDQCDKKFVTSSRLTCHKLNNRLGYCQYDEM